MVLSFSGGFLSTSSRSQVLNHEDHLQSVTDVNMSQPKTYRYVHQVSNFFYLQLSIGSSRNAVLTENDNSHRISIAEDCIRKIGCYPTHSASPRNNSPTTTTTTTTTAAVAERKKEKRPELTGDSL